MTSKQQDPPFITLSRENRIDAIVEGLEVIGGDFETNRVSVRAKPKRYLLVEENLGAARPEQTHYLTTHDALGDAAEYHLGQEYPEDWSIAFAVDLDNGQRYSGEIAGVTWSAEPWETT